MRLVANHRARLAILGCEIILLLVPLFVWGQDSDYNSLRAFDTTNSDGGVLIEDVRQPSTLGVDWAPLSRQTMSFLGIMHGFRVLTEPGTRMGMSNSIAGGYLAAVGNLHGWSDGDPAYVNLIGHPIQGMVSGYIWIQNDRRYRGARFGKSRDYWMGRLRAYGFSWAFSEQFEIGPVSEASIGQIQRYYPQQGFTDHIITPNLGIGLLIAEDALDEHVVRRLEQLTTSSWKRALLRVGMNPVQSFANVIASKPPWHRTTRLGVKSYWMTPAGVDEAESFVATHNARPLPKVERFSFGATAQSFFLGGKSCLGGGGEGSFRISDTWHWSAEVSGCRLLGLPPNWSGDSLTFTTGPQWSNSTSRRFNWRAHCRVGGHKVTQEYIDPVMKKLVLAIPPSPPDADPNIRYQMYSKTDETTGLALSLGGGLGIGLNPAFELRLANLEYVHSWMSPVNGTDFNHGFRFSVGIALRIGTW